MIVVDASVILSALTEEGAVGENAMRRLADDSNQHSPQIVKAEALSGLRRMAAHGNVTLERATNLTRQIERLQIDTYPVDALVHRVWELRHNLSVYDAWYVALAEALDTTLVTTDGRLARSPSVTCDVDLID